jgi:hypothetical protein
MNVVLEIHFAFAFLVFLVALFMGWVQLGRSVVNAVLGIQVLIGIVVAGVAGASHLRLPPLLWVHVVAALLAMGTYIAARRVLLRSPESNGVALALSFLGLVLIAFTIWFGWHLVLTQGV